MLLIINNVFYFKKYISNIWKYFFFIVLSWGLIMLCMFVFFFFKWYDEIVCMIFVEISLILDLYYKFLGFERDVVVERFEFNVRYSLRRKFSFNFNFIELIILVFFFWLCKLFIVWFFFLLYRLWDNFS